MAKRSHTRRKRDLVIGLLLLTAFALAGLSARMNDILSWYAIPRLEEFVRTSSNGSYTLHCDRMEFHPASRELIMYGVQLVDASPAAASDTTGSDPLRPRRTEAARIRIQGIGMGKASRLLLSEAAPWTKSAGNSAAADYLTGPQMGASVESLSIQWSRGLYISTAGRLSASIGDSSVELTGFRLQPLYNETEFSRHVPYREDRFDLSLDTLKWKGIDLHRLAKVHEAAGRSLALSGWKLDIYLDFRKRPAPAHTPPLFPNEALQKIPFPLMLDSLLLTRGTISYRERRPGYSQPAAVTFDDITATLSPASTASADSSTVSVLYASLALMGKGRVWLEADSPLLQKTFVFHSRGEVHRMELRDMEQYFENSSNVRIEGGTVDSVRYSMSARGRIIRGEVASYYHGIRFRLEPEGGFVAGEISRAKTFLARTFAIRPDNLPGRGDPIRFASVRHVREADETFFLCYWKTLRMGLERILGL